MLVVHVRRKLPYCCSRDELCANFSWCPLIGRHGHVFTGATMDASDARAAWWPQEPEEGRGRVAGDVSAARQQLRVDAVRGAYEGHQGQEVSAQASHGTCGHVSGILVCNY